MFARNKTPIYNNNFLKETNTWVVCHLLSLDDLKFRSPKEPIRFLPKIGKFGWIMKDSSAHVHSKSSIETISYM